MPRSYRKEIYQRVKHILWGPLEVIAAILGVLLFVNRPIMKAVQDAW